MDSRAGNTADPRGSRGAVSILDSADIEVTDSRLPHSTLVEHRSQHRRSETLGTCMEPPPVNQNKASYALKLPQVTDQFSVELVRGPVGFGFTLKGGRGVSGDVPLAVHGLLKDGPAHRCGLLQAGDLVLHINGESTQGLTHAQVVERIRAGGPRLCLVLRRPQERDASRTEEIGGHQKRDCSPDPRRSRMRKSHSTISPVHQPPKTRTSLKSSSDAVAVGHVVPIVEQPAEDLNDRVPGAPGTPGPWLVPSEDRLSQALGVRGGGGGAQLAQEMAAGRRRH
ncbi:PDZ domain-containing protein MAGIX isoform X2 [Phodopus roborovskii]|uniref:PDZ domain-containing protein MAGIX isoform X2 n=1 Tax=Phodopus roborovskii TaxID=109678 RepID=UPI0021E39504|nr:PDZ domain-containing protein MAGIX isoform X2 [Phodopus roborovskii]